MAQFACTSQCLLCSRALDFLAIGHRPQLRRLGPAFAVSARHRTPKPRTQASCSFFEAKEAKARTNQPREIGSMNKHTTQQAKSLIMTNYSKWDKFAAGRVEALPWHHLPMRSHCWLEFPGESNHSRLS